MINIDDLKLIETRNKPLKLEEEIRRNNLKKEILKCIINEAKKEDIVYILGHKNPDADSIFSSIVLAHVLNKLGINAKAAKLKNDYSYTLGNKKIIEDYLKEELELYDDSKKVILVDHNNLDGINKNNVIGAIDHHIITGEVLNLIEIEYASTGLLIYDLFKDLVKLTKEDKILIGLTVLTDTDYLISTRFTYEDKILFNELGFNKDINNLQKKYFVINDFSRDIKYNLKYDYKEYDRFNKHIKRSTIISYNKEYIDNIDKYLNYIKEDNYLLIWLDYENKITHIYFNKNNINLDYIISSTNIILGMLKEVII